MRSSFNRVPPCWIIVMWLANRPDSCTVNVLVVDSYLTRSILDMPLNCSRYDRFRLDITRVDYRRRQC
jgi:hypothetical protein